MITAVVANHATARGAVVRLIVEELVKEVAEHEAVVGESGRAKVERYGPRREKVYDADRKALAQLDVEAVERVRVCVVRQMRAVAGEPRALARRHAVQDPAVN